MGLELGKMDLPGNVAFVGLLDTIFLFQRFLHRKYFYGTYQVGLKGEAMNLHSPNSISAVDWMQASLIAQRQQPLTWHKVLIKQWKIFNLTLYLANDDL